MLQQLISKLDKYREISFDLVRMYLGVGIFVRGILFAYDSSAFMELIPANTPAWVSSPGVLNAVAFIHILGGLAIAVGFWTRVASIIQVPILFGAIFLSVSGLFSTDESFELSTLVLFLLLLVIVCGSGRWSIDHYWQRGRVGFRQILEKLYDYRSIAFDLLRIYLGIGLFLRGILFISDAGNYMALLSSDSSAFLSSTVLIHYVALAHIFGGLMMTAGLLTRVAALIQIPILTGAVVVSQAQGGLLASNQSLELAALTLFLLLLIFLYGSGKWSSEHYLFKQKPIPDSVARTEHASEILTHTIPTEGPFPNPVATMAVPEAMTTPESITQMHDNPLIVSHARYGFMGWLLFLIDVTPRPKEIIFRNVQTGEVVKRSKDPVVLERFRYN